MFTDTNMLGTESPITPATMSLQGLSEHLATHHLRRPALFWQFSRKEISTASILGRDGVSQFRT
jgi:hypothetical protein